MKTQLKISLFVCAGMAILAGCKGKNDSSSSSASPSEVAASPKGNSVMDSLSITDPDEKKVCALYDDAITDYMKELKTVGADTSKAAAQKRAGLDKEYQAREKAIRPQIESLRQKLVSNPMEESKFIQFSAYESKRLMSVMGDFTKGLMKNIPTPAPADN